MTDIIRGPKGEQGPPGLPGPKGDQGSRGVQGLKGDQGPVGLQGPQGVPGFRGPRGPKGDQGPFGMPGPKGDRGDQGPVGAKGDQGDRGEHGPRGIPGPQGPNGTIGPVGPQGVAGPVGPQGPQGVQGIAGPKGDTGLTGPRGEPGQSAVGGAAEWGAITGTLSSQVDLANILAGKMDIEACQTQLNALNLSISNLLIRTAQMNRTPQLVEDNISVPDSSNQTISGNVLENDNDPDGDVLLLCNASYNGDIVPIETYYITNYGTMFIDRFGNYLFTITDAAHALKVGQTATEVFGYTVIDSHSTRNSSQLTITIIGTDELPVAIADESLIPFGQTASGNVLGNDRDPEGMPIYVNSMNINGISYGANASDIFEADLPNIGVVSINTSGTYSFVPASGFSGVVPTISYIVTDGVNSQLGRLSLVVQANPVAMLSNPVTLALTGLHTYNVGPGQTYDHPDSVPWSDLQAGDVVNIFYRPTPYIAKIAMRCRGSFTNPVIINGVTDANGNRPIINGNGAQTPQTCASGDTRVFNTPSTPGTQGVGTIIIRRGTNEIDPAYRPGHIQIKNLTVTGAAGGNSYTTHDDVTESYSFSAGIYGRSAEHVLVENCVIYDNILGIFTHVSGSDPLSRCDNWTIRSNRFHDNGSVGSDTVHGMYLQGCNFTVEYNYIGQLRASAGGSSYKSRIGGEIFRYNWVEANARAMDFVEMEDQYPWNVNDPNSAIGKPNYGIDYGYGNVIINDYQLPNGASYRPIHYGGDNIGEQTGPGAAISPLPTHRKKLYFFNNTFLSNISGNAPRNFIFQISLRDIVVEAWNNIFYLVGNVPLAWTQHAGTINFRGTNLVYRSGGTLENAQYDATPANVLLNELGTKITSNPQFLNTATGEYDLTLSENSPAMNIGTEVPAGLPAGFGSDWSVSSMPRMRANGSENRITIGAGTELGAFEVDPSAPPNFAPVNTLMPSVLPTVAAIGDTLTVVNGQWLHMGAGTYSHQWQRNDNGTWSNIANATSLTYVVELSGDHRCVVSATNAIGTTTAASDLSVVSVVAIDAPTIGAVAAEQSAYRNNGGISTGFDTQASGTNIVLFVYDSDATTPMTSSNIYDNAGNNGNWQFKGSQEITDGPHNRRVSVFCLINGSGKTGHTIDIYPGEFSYTSAFAVEILGNIEIGQPIMTAASVSPYQSSAITTANDSLLLAFAGSKFTTNGSFEWSGGFAPVVNAQLTTLGTDDRANGSVTSRVAAAGSFAPSVSIPTGSPDSSTGMIILPIRKL